jgi:outer membrane protein insertion porin family
MKQATKISVLTFAVFLTAAIGRAALSRDSVIVNPDIVYSTKQNSYLLGGFTISGVTNYDEELLRNISELKVGQVITVPGADITNVVQRYWKQKIFSDVSVSADSIVGNKIFLHIKLTARPKISSINYHGVKKSQREDLEERLGLKAGSQVSPDILDRAKIIIKRYYEEKGFKNATVDIVQQDDVSAANQVIIDINIDRNEKIKVKHIYFTGIKQGNVKKLKRAMKKTHEVNKLANMFRAKKFLPEEYKKDKGFIIDKYNEWGFRDAIITKDSITPYDEKHVDLHIDIEEGRKYYLRNVNWVGNTVYSSESLARAFKMKSGDVYNQSLMKKRLNDDEDAIGNQYYNNGYVFYNLNPVETNIDGDSVDLEMRIYEGQQATLNHIRITGNKRVYENVVRRELRTKPGDLFSKEAVMRSLRDLASLNFFDPEKIEPDIKPDQENGTVDINYNLVPKPSDQVQISFGWGQTGIVGTVGLKFTNFSMQNLFNSKNRRALFPQGDGQQLSLSAQTNGTYYQNYSFNFLDPWFGGKRPNSLSLSAFFSKQTDVNSNYYNSSYWNNYQSYLYGYGTSGGYYNNYSYYDPDKYVKIYGVSLGWGKRLRWPDDYFSLTAEVTFQRYDLKSWQYFIITDGVCNNFNVSLTLSRNSTDNPIFPRKGSDFVLSVAATPPYSLWDNKDYKSLALDYRSSSYNREMQEKYRWVEYHKWKFKLRTYTALTGKNKCPVLMTRTDFGILGHYNKYKKSPFETFYMGGDGMSGYSSGYATETIGLRGYENGCLTPYGSEGYAYSRLSVELRYPLMLKGQTNIYALAFAEGGNAWTDVKKFNPFDMKRSAGVGVRIYLPMVGLMGLDWAYGFDKVFGSAKNGGSHIHFIIGQEF